MSEATQNCPDANSIVEFVDGRLSPSAQNALEEHIDGCSECRSLVAEFGRSAAVGWEAQSAGDVIVPGATIGRYTVVEEVGAGAMGVVFRAWDPELERDVALKLVRVLGLAPSEAEEARRRLLLEARAMARLSSPHVVGIYEANVVGDAVYIAMELVEGVNLSTWLALGERHWTEVVDCALGAAKGLAAAHAEGIVHRDFKPANVLIGPASRVRVTDFGLALHAGADAADAQRSRGTPAYMSPEARAHKAVDARSDQYSFAVSLCEALCGQRPDGESLPALGAPPRIARILRRALKKNPEERYRNTDELVAALDRARTFQRRVTLASLGVFAIACALVVGFASAARRTSAVTCSAGTEHIAELWNAERRAQAKAAFVASGLSFADQVFATASANLDGFERAWTSAYQDSCEATHVRGEQSEALLDLRTRCLRDELEVLRTATDVFVSASPAIVKRAISISRVDEGLGRCSNSALLLREAERPTGVDAGQEVDRIARAYTAVRSMGLEGKQAEALEQTKVLVEDAKRVGYKRLEAALVGHLGELQWRLGAIDEAVANLYEGVAAAEVAHAIDIRGGLLSTLVAVVGFEQARYDEALQIARLAEIALRSIDDPGRLANLMSNRGSIHFAKGQYDLAREAYEDAHAIMKVEYPEGDARLGQILNNLALMSEQASKHEDAYKTYSEALAIYEQALGAVHPQVALSLANRATSLMNLERTDEAFRDLERALAIRKEALGPEHASVGETYRIMAQFAMGAGDAARSLQNCEKAEGILLKSVPKDHPEMAAFIATKARALLELGRTEEALTQFREAFAIWDARKLASPHISMTRFHYGRALARTSAGRSRGRAMILKARSELAEDPESLTDIDAWLEKHR